MCVTLVTKALVYAVCTAVVKVLSSNPPSAVDTSVVVTGAGVGTGAGVVVVGSGVVVVVVGSTVVVVVVGSDVVVVVVVAQSSLDVDAAAAVHVPVGQSSHAAWPV